MFQDYRASFTQKVQEQKQNKTKNKTKQKRHFFDLVGFHMVF